MFAQTNSIVSGTYNNRQECEEIIQYVLQQNILRTVSFTKLFSHYSNLFYYYINKQKTMSLNSFYQIMLNLKNLTYFKKLKTTKYVSSSIS